MTYKTLFIGLCACALLFAGNLGGGVKYNVLFIAADDMNNDLGAFGVSQVKTPNLERLAAMGVRFDRAYCQQPLCGPSRASVMTGLRPDTLDMHSLEHELRQKNPDVVTLGQLFRNNGYFSARAGKIYHYGNPSMIGTDGHDDPETWDKRFNPVGIDKMQEENIIRYGPNPTPRKHELGISMAWWDPVSRDEEHTDGMVAEKIIELTAVTQVWHNRKSWGYSLRNERWRYTEWLEGEAGIELYDHENDPGETRNLANDPSKADFIQELSARLKPFVQLKAHKRE